MATTTMTKAEASVKESFVENRFEDIDQCRFERLGRETVGIPKGRF